MGCALGCAANGGSGAQQAAPRPAANQAAPAAPAAPPPSAEAAVLDGTGLGRVKLGAPLPPDLAVAARYHTSYYADAQPLEGFVLGSPGVLAIVDGGAFPAYGNAHPGATAPDDLRARTLAAGAASKLSVRMIVVTDPSVATANGLRVGTDLAGVRAAFPDARLQRVPPLWEDPTCLIEAAGLAFFFDRCPRSDGDPPANDAKVARIVARRADSP
jgi:hypothetical protein